MKLVLAAALIGAVACASPPAMVDGGPQIRIGPVALAAVDAGAPEPAVDDSRWAPLEEGVSLQRASVYWLRAPVELAAAPEPGQPLGVAVSLLASYELVWDGAVIGRSGRVGASQRDELPGAIDAVFALPAATPGPHHLALRLSNFHYRGNLSNSFYRLRVDRYRALITDDVRARFPPLLALGWLIAAAALWLVIYLALGRRPSALLFAAICALVAVALLGQSWRWIAGYSYDHHLTRLRVVTAASFGAALLLPLAFAHDLAARRRRLIAAVSLAAATAALIVPDGYNSKARLMFVAAVGIALGVAAAAAVRGQRGARPALLGLGLCLTPLPIAPDRYHDAGFFLGFSALLVAVLGIAGMRFLDERRAASQATLRSARLELELVKRGIQPHFVMNVLTSILEWIEQEPARAARFVEALADELRLLSRVATHRLIPIELELELCRAHLALMSQRLERELALSASGIAAADEVPPALFHTLLENATTHGSFPDGPVRFALAAERAGRRRRYRMVSPELSPAPAAADGTGLRYVRARLHESYGERWSLTAGPTAAGWETAIEIEDG